MVPLSSGTGSMSVMKSTVSTEMREGADSENGGRVGESRYIVS